MAKKKQRKKGPSKLSTTGSKAQTAASQAGTNAQGSASQVDGKAKAAAPQKSGKAHAKEPRPGGKAKVTAPKADNKATMLPSMSRRNALRAVAASVVVVGAGMAIHRHDVQARYAHDLSAIGKGIPTVVQIHDPSCSLCRRLMGATRKAMQDFPGVAYRVADITTNEGHTFQAKYDVPNVTLLLFDSKGGHIETLNGVRDADELRELFAQTFGDTATRDAEALS